MAESQTLTIGDTAAHFGCREWQVRRLFTRKLLPEPERHGAFRVIRRKDLPKIEAALRSAGYIDAEEAVAST